MRKKLSNFFKIYISILAIVNLVALFVFEYDFSFFNEWLSIGESQEEETVEETEETSKPQWKFQFETDTLTYDGTEEFDLLEGVTLLDPLGQPSNIEIFVRITTAENISSKIIEYSADTEDGRVTGTRKLQLMNYQGPSIDWNPEITSVETKDMNAIGSLLIESGDLKATDGYEVDISQAITATYTRDEENLALIHCSFVITNMFNDTARLNVDLTLKLNKPLIVLTESSVIVKKGSQFNPESYIDVAMDIDGSALYDRITIEGSVDVNTLGTYTIKYFTYNNAWVYSSPEALTVIVIE